LAVESKDSRQESLVYTAIGVTYGYQCMYKELIEYQLKALKINERTNDKQGIQSALSNIGNAYSALNDNEQALEYQEKALAMAEELNLTNAISSAHYCLASTNFSLKNFGKAENHLLKALELARKQHGNQAMISYILIALQELYSEGIVDLEKAEKYGKEGLEIAEQLHNPSLKANAYKGMADIYRIQGRYKDCDIAATKSWEMDSVNIDLTIATTANLTHANIHLGNKQKALLFFDKYYNIVNKYNEKSLHESLASQQVKYETEKKEIRIVSLEKERQLYVWLGVAASILALFSVIVLLLIIRNARREKQLIAVRAIQMERTQYRKTDICFIAAFTFSFFISMLISFCMFYRIASNR
jgi:tetratricopeptide (TPR) repeat protein